MMEKGKKLYEGKAKIIYATKDKNQVIQHFKDDATAFNNKKKAPIDGITINDLNKTKLEVWLPDPLGVATCIEKSLMILVFCSISISLMTFTFRLLTKMCSPVGYYKTSVCIKVHNTISYIKCL